MGQRNCVCGSYSHEYLNDHKMGNGIEMHINWNYPLPRMPVTTRIIPFFVGNPYINKPSFVTIASWARGCRSNAYQFFDGNFGRRIITSEIRTVTKSFRYLKWMVS